jgi:hypothetical protein
VAWNQSGQPTSRRTSLPRPVPATRVLALAARGAAAVGADCGMVVPVIVVLTY